MVAIFFNALLCDLVESFDLHIFPASKQNNLIQQDVVSTLTIKSSQLLSVVVSFGVNMKIICNEHRVNLGLAFIRAHFYCLYVGK